MAAITQLIAYVRTNIPVLPSSFNQWLQGEDKKIEDSINSLIVAVNDLRSRVAALEAKGS